MPWTLAERYMREHDVEVVPCTPSSTLARQIANGAPAAIYLSANERDGLAGRQGGVALTQRHDVLTNRLALVRQDSGPRPTPNATTPIAERLGEGRLARATRRMSPPGLCQASPARLGQQALRARQPAPTVRTALALVERGEAPLGIVYASDARASDKIETWPPRYRPGIIIYPMALIGEAPSDAWAWRIGSMAIRRPLSFSATVRGRRRRAP